MARTQLAPKTPRQLEVVDEEVQARKHEETARL